MTVLLNSPQREPAHLLKQAARAPALLLLIWTCGGGGGGVRGGQATSRRLGALLYAES